MDCVRYDYLNLEAFNDNSFPLHRSVCTVMSRRGSTVSKEEGFYL